LVNYEMSKGMKITKKKLLSLFTIILVIMLLGCASTSPAIQDRSDGSESMEPLDVQRVSVEESKAAFDSDEAVFLDVRSESSYAASNIPGALSIPLAELQTRMAELDPNQWIITYCT